MGVSDRSQMTYIEEVNYDMRIKNIEALVQSKNTNCLNCSVGITKPIQLDTTDLYEDPSIQVVHDIEVECDYTKSNLNETRKKLIKKQKPTKKPFFMNCNKGDKENTGIRCSCCKYATKQTEATLKSNGKDVKQIQVLYQCKKSGKITKGEYYRAYYRCENFVKKE